MTPGGVLVVSPQSLTPSVHESVVKFHTIRKQTENVNVASSVRPLPIALLFYGQKCSVIIPNVIDLQVHSVTPKLE